MTDNSKQARLEALGDIKLYTLQELAEALEVSYKTMLLYCKSGKLKANKIGGRWKVSQSNLDKFLNGEQ